MNMENETRRPQPVGLYRPNCCLYHASPKGTGSAIKMNLHPAHDDTDGCIMLMIAKQKVMGNLHAETRVYPKFDWENAICVKLDFSDLTQMLQVFRGECESINEGKGLFHRSVKAMTSIKLKHLVEPVAGYVLEIDRRMNGEVEKDSSSRFFFYPAEALGLCEAITGALYLICFGIPMLVPHDTSAYRAEARGIRNAPAA